MSIATDSPTMSPPQFGEVSAAAGTSAPTLTGGDATASATAATPRLDPPSVTAATAGAGSAVTGTWTASATIDALWSINEIRNAFMHVAGGAWKKIFNGNDGAFTALLTLASQARQTGSTINFREEADGMVHEIYFW